MSLVFEFWDVLVLTNFLFLPCRGVTYSELGGRTRPEAIASRC